MMRLILALLIAAPFVYAQPFWDTKDARKIWNRPIAPTAPSEGQSLVWDGSAWVPTTAAGSGGGVTYAPTRTSDTVLTLPAIAANTMAVSSYVCPSAISAGATFTVSSGTGTLWVALGSDCTVKVRHNVVGSCSAGCTAVGSSSGFDVADLPLYEWAVTSGALASTGTAKLVAHRALGIAAGSNVSFVTNNGVTTISATGGGITAGTSIPTSCTAGDQYWHTTYKELFSCGVANFYEPVGGAGRNWRFVDEFRKATESGNNLRTDWFDSWVKGGSNCNTFASTASTDPHIGIANLPNGTGGSGVCVMDAQSFAIPAASLSDFYFQAVFRLNRIAAQSKFFVGLATNGSTTVTPATRLGLRFDGATSTTVLVTDVCAASSCTNTNSTVTASANWMTLRIWRYGGNVFFSVNDETAISVAATNIPAGAVDLYIATQNTDTTATSVDVDKVAMWIAY
jgi:hypothetical protein